MNLRIFCVAFILAAFCLVPTAHAQENPWVVYAGGDGPGKGKHIVLVSGDEEYRSEEALSQLGKILARHHGFKCTVLFAIEKDQIWMTKDGKEKGKAGKEKTKNEEYFLQKNPRVGQINPNVTDNIPGLENLKTADLMIIATRFRNLPEEQMQHIVDYVDTGKPIIGMRTATHAFAGIQGKFAKYNNGAGDKDFKGGFGRQVLGEKWVNHHGGHGSQSTRGILNQDEAKHPILTGLKDGDIWGPTDVYEANPLKPSTILVHGQVLTGMKSTDEPLKGKKNEPMMPVAWTREYKGGRIFTTTMGASQDLEAAGTRRMLVNASLWCVGLEKAVTPTLSVDIVGDFQPNRFGNDKFKKGVRPSQLSMK